MAAKKPKKSASKAQAKPPEVPSKGPRNLIAGAVIVAALGMVMAAGPWFKTSNAPQYSFRIVNKIPHDKEAYTQGLLVKDGYFYESTGLYGKSTVRKLDMRTGAVLDKVNVDSKYFGEGLVFFKGVFIQLTWQGNKALIYNSDTLEQIRSFDYDSEGWGITTDGNDLFMSDGSHKIYVRSATDFSLKQTLEVYDESRKVSNLNEMEYIDGEIWANIYRTFKIARISPDDGRLLGIIDFRGILGNDRRGDEDTFNGIAWSKKGNRIFVTGKRYSYIYEIEVIKTDS